MARGWLRICGTSACFLCPNWRAGWPQLESLRLQQTSPVEARCIALVLTSLGLQHRALRRLGSGFFCPGKYACMLWAGQCFMSERKRPRIAEMDCAGKEPNLPGVKAKNLPGVYRAIYRELPGVTGSYRELPHLPGATRMPIYRELTGSLPGVPGASQNTGSAGC